MTNGTKLRQARAALRAVCALNKRHEWKQYDNKTRCEVCNVPRPA